MIEKENRPDAATSERAENWNEVLHTFSFQEQDNIFRVHSCFDCDARQHDSCHGPGRHDCNSDRHGLYDTIRQPLLPADFWQWLHNHGGRCEIWRYHGGAVLHCGDYPDLASGLSCFLTAAFSMNAD